MHERVASADCSPNLRHQEAAFTSHLQNFAERDFEVLLNVVAQSLQRRNVEHFRAILKIASQRLPHQSVNAGEERGEGLARASRRGNQGCVTCQNVRPSLLLRLSRRTKSPDKPIPYEWMCPGER